MKDEYSAISSFPRSGVGTQFRDAPASQMLTKVEPSLILGRWSVQNVRSHAGAWERGYFYPLSTNPLTTVILKLLAPQPGDFGRVFVAAAGETNDDDLVRLAPGGLLHRLGHGVRTFQRRQDAFRAGQRVESVQGLVVAGAGVLARPVSFQ